jgi:hypothetical protein
MRRFKFFDKPSVPNAPPSLVASPTVNFESLEHGGRQMALADADTPTIMAHSVIIEFVDDPSVSERWVRDGNGWTSIDA